jgi:predicted O-methyltransferase YrrM
MDEKYILGPDINFTGSLLEKYNSVMEISKKDGIPIVKPQTARLLLLCALMKKPKRILEIGSGYGYSSLLLSESLDYKGIIDTIEIKEKNAEITKNNIKIMNKEQSINLIYGDALEILPMFKNKYDFIFIDASKGQYPEFLKYAKALIGYNGVIFADNILYQGIVENPDKSSRRDLTIVKRLNMYIQNMLEDKKFESNIVNIEDGIMISYLK